jgi:hypothetical protein
VVNPVHFEMLPGQAKKTAAAESQFEQLSALFTGKCFEQAQLVARGLQALAETPIDGACLKGLRITHGDGTTIEAYVRIYGYSRHLQAGER